MLLPPTYLLGPWPHVFAVQGPGGNSGTHRHVAMHLLLARQDTMEVMLAGQSQRVAGLLTPPNFPHAADARGSTALMVFVEPTCPVGQNLRAQLDDGPMLLDRDAADRLLADLPPQPTTGDLERWVRELLPQLGLTQPAPRHIHPKVSKLLRRLETAPLHPAPTLEVLADQVGLSPSRLMHIFTEATGVPFRMYLRWLRFTRACVALTQGASLSDAAAQAGFADAAHMSRTFKEMYGLAPSQLRY